MMNGNAVITQSLLNTMGLCLKNVGPLGVIGQHLNFFHHSVLVTMVIAIV
jgi:hypothetical protein